MLDAQILSKETIRQQEPHLSQEITQTLSLPSTMVTFPWEVAFHALENAIMNGLEIQLNAEVTGIKKQDTGYQIEINHNGVFFTHAVINAAGIYSDVIAKMVEEKPEFVIRPRRGEYYVLDKRVKGWVNRVIYPLPTALGKGVLIVPQVHGNILLGPTSIPQQDKQSVATTTGGLMLIKASLQGLSDSIPYHAIIRQFAGVRASSTYDEFYIQESKTSPHVYHVAGIDSPGLTAAPAIAKYLIEKVIHLQVPKKTDFIASISKKPRYAEASEQEQIALFQQNSQYGNMVCKCEHVTEAEIVAAIHGPLGSHTIKGIKKRTRAGSGLCQGGYCEREVAKIIARETKMPLMKIVYHHPQSTILLTETKVKK